MRGGGLMRIFHCIADHFRPVDAAYPQADDCCGRYSFRAFLLLLLIWMALWTLLPSLCIGNIPIDVAENIAWGQQFDLGYDKNPYFGAWLTTLVFRFMPYDWAFYLMSQLAVFVGLSAVYVLTFEVTRCRFAAFVAGISTLLIPFFSHSANEFNDDVMSIALWGLTALWTFRAVRRGTIGAYVAAGVFAGLAIMTKYLAGALLLPLGMLFLITREGRAAWKKPGLYLGIAVFLLLVAPNVVWLFKHDFIAIDYAFGRARLQEEVSWSDHLLRPLDFLCSFFARLLLPVAAILLFRRSRRRADDGFGRALLWSVGIGPLALSLAFSVVTGGDVLNSWLTPYYVFSTPLMVMEYRPVPEARTLKRFAALFVAAVVLMIAVFGYEYLYKRPFRKRGGYNVYPGRPVAAELTERWRRIYNRPVPYVIGDRTASCYMKYYSEDRPQVFLENDPKLSPLIDPADVARRGGVVIWRHDPPPGYLNAYPRRSNETIVMTYERAVPRWWRALVGSPGEVTVKAMFVAPAE